MLVLFDLHAYEGGPLLSPMAARVRLALIHKQLPFRIHKLTYTELRSQSWGEKAGCDENGKATVPFIVTEDGEYVRDSINIWKWLDKKYPDKRNIFLPTATMPVDVEAHEYVAALSEFDRWKNDGFSLPAYVLLIKLFGPKVAALLREKGALSDYEYYTGPTTYRWAIKEDEWETLMNLEPAAEDELVATVRAAFVDPLEIALAHGDHKFLSTSDAPGAKDIAAYAMTPSLEAIDARLCTKIYKSDLVGAWLERMKLYYAWQAGDAS